jgi:hypothetical protein
MRRAESIGGSWDGDDGEKYVLREAGNVVWWLGKNGDRGKTWTNVFPGVITGNTRGRVSRPVAG